MLRCVANVMTKLWHPHSMLEVIQIYKFIFSGSVINLHYLLKKIAHTFSHRHFHRFPFFCIYKLRKKCHLRLQWSGKCFVCLAGKHILPVWIANIVLFQSNLCIHSNTRSFVPSFVCTNGGFLFLSPWFLLLWPYNYIHISIDDTNYYAWNVLLNTYTFACIHISQGNIYTIPLYTENTLTHTLTHRRGYPVLI